MKKIQLPALTSDEEKVLRLIRSQDGASEGEIMAVLFPAPKYPDGAKVGSAESRAWFDQNAEWQAKAFGGSVHHWDGSVCEVTPHAQTYDHTRFIITQRLTKLGLIREHNNGFNAYHWTAI